MRKKIYLDRNFCFTGRFEESFINQIPDEAEKVTIPHTVAMTPLNYFDESIYQMVSCYQRKFIPDDSFRGKEVILTFEAAAHEATVYLNGELLGVHSCGYTAFSFDISDKLIFGKENLITVKLDSRESLNVPPFGFVVDYMTYGGIYRDVYLIVKDRPSIEDVFFMPSVDLKDNSGTLSCQVTSNGNGRFAVYLNDKKIGETDRADFSFECGKVKLWDTDRPELYTARVDMISKGKVTDSFSAQIGFRKSEFRTDGYYLNGRKVLIRGLNRHQSYPYAGYAMPASMQKLDVSILKDELGVNAVRTSHYPQSQDFIDECDRRGLLVFTEFPGWQHIGDKAWQDQGVKNLEEMVIQYRNHPSIILWGVRINESRDCDPFYERTNRLCRQLDPTRQTGGVRCDKKMHMLEDVYTYNDFSCDGSEGPGILPKSKVTPDVSKPYLVSENNGHMYPTKAFDWEEHRREQAMRHARVLDSVAGADGVSGSFAWCMFDYNTHKDFGSGDRICYHGVLDMFRNPKNAAYVYSAEGSEEDVLAVTSSMDVGEHPASVLGDIYILTNADSVKMYKNGALIKEYFPSDSLFRNLKHGPIVIDDFIGDLMKNGEGYSDRQNELAKYCLNTVALHGYKMAPKLIWSALQLILLYHMKVADATDLFQKYVGNWGGKSVSYKFEAVRNGKTVKTVVKSPMKQMHLHTYVSSDVLYETYTYDVAEIRLLAEDENGNVLNFANLPVSVSCDGPVEVYGPSVFSLNGGMGGVYIRSTGEAGTGTVRIKAGDCEEAVINIGVEKLITKES